ncbi:MAG: YggS family pyridoxal phosphate-dependent enzyme [Treponema sp.]|nr:YggS family pyridoxal phosphate-dependent enzyme [Treponema sp.]
MSIAGNIAKIEERLITALGRAGRKRDDVILMGVSKFVPVEMIKQAFDAGIRHFGESRVKEAGEKLNDFNDNHPGAQIHLIGSLQRNKAKQAALFFDCIQSVDREELILELEKYSSLREKRLDILLELHTGEETKNGFADLESLFRAAELTLKSKTLKPLGLMTMAPFTSDTDVIRSSFRRLVKAQKELIKRFPNSENWSCLSMGMSNDFEIAIEEGSTLLRIGSAIFNGE